MLDTAVGEIQQLPPKWGFGVSIGNKQFAFREKIPEDTPHVINVGEVNSKAAALQHNIEESNQ